MPLWVFGFLLLHAHPTHSHEAEVCPSFVASVFRNLLRKPSKGPVVLRANPEPGQEIPRDFTETLLLGSGSAGHVYAATMPTQPVSALAKRFAPRTRVALKLARRTENKPSLEWESEVSERIAPHDPNNIFVRSLWDPERQILVSELVDGQDLTALFDKGQPLSRKAREHIGKQLQEALRVLKAAQFVHGDLRAPNILLEGSPNIIAGEDHAQYRVRIVDFGISAPVGGYARPLEARRVRSGATFSTSPNQGANGPAAFEDDAYSVQRLKLGGAP